MLIMGTSFAAIDLKLDKVSLGKVTKFFRLLPTHFLVFQFYTILKCADEYRNCMLPGNGAKVSFLFVPLYFFCNILLMIYYNAMHSCNTLTTVKF